MGALLAVAEIYSRHKRTLDNVTLKDAMIVGLAQCGALIPGVSRSGATFTAALFRDLERTEAARFSFLLGIPAIAAAGIKELYELHKAHLDAHGWSILAFGLVVASISAFVAIWGLLRILERFSSWPFAIYRVVLGVFLLVAGRRTLAAELTDTRWQGRDRAAIKDKFLPSFASPKSRERGGRRFD